MDQCLHRCVVACCYRRLIFITIYFQGSYYLKVQDSQQKTHHLLDASFPSFNNKARGITLSCTWKDQIEEDPKFHFRDLMVWEQVVRAMPVDFAAELRKAATKRSKRIAKGKLKKRKVPQKKEANAPAEDAEHSSGDAENSGGASKGEMARRPKQEEGKQSSNSKPTARAAAVPENNSGSDSDVSDAEEEEDAAKKKGPVDMDVHQARNPHFVAKIALPDRLKHLQKTMGPAPWDATGKPKLFGKK